MLITPEILKAAPIEDDCRLLPNETRIHRNADIGDNVEIGDNVVIGDNVIIGNESEIHDNSTIEDGVSIGDGAIICDYAYIGYHTIIGDSVYLKHNVQISSWVRIGNNVLVNDNARIPPYVTIFNSVKIFVMTLTFHAHYAGDRYGVHLFRLDREIHPLSWFTSRKRGCTLSIYYHSGWAWIWDRKEIAAEEYRRYLRFFMDEAKRLGI